MKAKLSWPSAALAAIVLLGLGLRLAPWGQNRFLEDEALYAYWGLQIATGIDPMLDEEPVDKPPLYPYLLAGSYWLSGTAGRGRPPEAPARLPSLLASLSGIVLVYALGRAVYGDTKVGLLAAALLAFSPFDALFASTAFTDPLMTAFVLAALLAAATGHPAGAGLLAGLAAATKQQGLFFLPLIVAFVALRPAGPKVEMVPGRKVGSWLRRTWAGPWVRFVLPLAAVIGGTLWWDAARLQKPGFWQQSLIAYGGLGPGHLEAVGQRAVDWLRLVASFWVSPWANALLIGALLAWWGGAERGRVEPWRRHDRLLGRFAVAFLLLHWLAGFQVWDRYLLGLVPLVALLLARALTVLGQAIQKGDLGHLPVWAWRACAAAFGLALVASLAGPVAAAAQGELPLGGDHGAYDGIDALAACIEAEAPPGAVLYHYWLGYHYRFYLYGAPLRLHWYPHLRDLAQDATIYRREPRFIALPSFRDTEQVPAALASAGIDLEKVCETRRRDGSVSFELYRLVGP